MSELHESDLEQVPLPIPATSTASADISDEPPVNVKKNKIVNKSKPSGGPVQLGSGGGQQSPVTGDVGPPVDDLGSHVPAPIVPVATAVVPAVPAVSVEGPLPASSVAPVVAYNEAPVFDRDVRADSKMRALTDSEDMADVEGDGVRSETESGRQDEEVDGDEEEDQWHEREYDEAGNYIEPGSRQSLYPKTFHDRFDCTKLQALDKLVRENI